MATTAKGVKKQIPASKGSNNIEDLPDHDANVAEIAFRLAENRGLSPATNLTTG